jgi:hypothetical protein
VLPQPDDSLFSTIIGLGEGAAPSPLDADEGFHALLGGVPAPRSAPPASAVLRGPAAAAAASAYRPTSEIVLTPAAAVLAAEEAALETAAPDTAPGALPSPQPEVRPTGQGTARTLLELAAQASAEEQLSAVSTESPSFASLMSGLSDAIGADHDAAGHSAIGTVGGRQPAGAVVDVVHGVEDTSTHAQADVRPATALSDRTTTELATTDVPGSSGPPTGTAGVNDGPPADATATPATPARPTTPATTPTPATPATPARPATSTARDAADGSAAVAVRSEPVGDDLPAQVGEPDAGVELARLGLPPHLRPSTVGQQLHTALRASLTRLPTAPPAINRAGGVLAIVGPLSQALSVAREIAEELGLPAATSVAVATSGAGSPDVADKQVLHGTAEAADRRAAWRRRSNLTVVAVDAPLTATGAAEARAFLAALSPSATWGAVEATRKAQDVAAWTRALGGVHALALTDVEDTADPAAVLELGIPVSRLGGRPATPRAWATLLTGRLAA